MVAQPGLPGATKRLPVIGDLAHARANACSRAPEPRISRFVLPSGIPFIHPAFPGPPRSQSRDFLALDIAHRCDLASAMISLTPEASNRKWTAVASHRAWLLREAEALFSFFERRIINPLGGFYDLDDQGRPAPPGYGAAAKPGR